MLSKVWYLAREDPDTGRITYAPELPEGFENVVIPLLVAFTDQGSVGMSALSFAKRFMGLSLVSFPDPFHRSPNDMKGACARSAGGVFRQALLHSTLLWSLNYKPFRSPQEGEKERIG